MRREASLRWRAVVGVDASVDPRGSKETGITGTEPLFAAKRRRRGDRGLSLWRAEQQTGAGGGLSLWRAPAVTVPVPCNGCRGPG